MYLPHLKGLHSPQVMISPLPPRCRAPGTWDEPWVVWAKGLIYILLVRMEEVPVPTAWPAPVTDPQPGLPVNLEGPRLSHITGPQFIPNAQRKYLPPVSAAPCLSGSLLGTPEPWHQWGMREPCYENENVPQVPNRKGLNGGTAFFPPGQPRKWRPAAPGPPLQPRK